MSTLLLAIIALNAGPQAALEAAIACYEDLDYACAEERLAESLSGGLEGPARQRARLYEALLAVAFRDTPRARRAVRALLEIDPGYDPGLSVPPQLRDLFEQERPEPVPPPTATARADFTSVQIFGQDADQWTEGLGVEVGGGVRLFGWLALEASAGFSDHAPREFAFVGMDLIYGTLGVGWRAAFGPLRGGVGLAAGAAYVDSDHGALGADEGWGAMLAVPFDVSWPLWEGFGLGVRVAPTSFVTEAKSNFAASFLLPLEVGVRYGD